MDWVPKKQLLWKFRGGWLGILETGGWRGLVLSWVSQAGGYLGGLRREQLE